MKLNFLVLLLPALFHSIGASFVPQEKLSAFNEYHGLLTYIFNETRSIGDAILSQIDDFLDAPLPAEPSEADEVVADLLLELVENEPQMPLPPDETFDGVTCADILGQLQALFELSKFFVLKAARNEEAIATLKNVAVELLRSDLANMEVVASVVETIADNYRAQNHVFATIKEVDREIEAEMRNVARFCNESRLRGEEEEAAVLEY